MIEERSYGVIPLRSKGDSWEVYLIQHRAGHWGFPKGHAENSETPKGAAIRELGEETQLSVTQWWDQTPPLEEVYSFMNKQGKVQKKVQYFLAEVTGNPQIQGEELIDGGWCSFEEALERLTFRSGKKLCREVISLIGQ